jgi:methyl-accepting chemotaxis protein
MKLALIGFRRQIRQLGIVPRLLVVSLLATVVTVATVQKWTLHVVTQSQDVAAQAQLNINLSVLQHVLGQHGADWSLDADGRLLVDGKPAEGLDQVVDNVSRITHGVTTIFAGEKRVATTVTRPDGSRAVGTALAAGPAHDAVVGRGEPYRGMAQILGATYFTVYEPLRSRSGQPVGILFVGIPNTVIQTVLSKIVWDSSLVALAVTLAAGAIQWLMLRSTMRPLRVLAAAVNTITDGRFDVSVPCADRTDQLGEIGRAVASLRDKARNARALELQAAEEQEKKARNAAEIDRLSQDFGQAVSGVLSGLVTSAGAMRRVAGEMATSAERTSNEMTAAASEAEQSSQNLTTVAAATEQLTSTVVEIARRADDAAKAAHDAVNEAQTTATTVQRLESAAAQISEVVSLIDSIAGRTNLLALNATIEAARAGEAGKGFAIVAGEVKQLATQTAAATRQIGTQITAMQSATMAAVDAVKGVTTAIGRVSEVASAIAAAAEEQDAATREIAAQVHVVATATDRAARTMLDVSAAAAKSSSLSQNVETAADQVMRDSGILRDDVDHFVTAMQVTQQQGNRRRYKRISGGRTEARLQSPRHGSATATIVDLSLGGAALSSEWRCDAGAEISVDLPGSDAAVLSRVVSADGRLLRVMFRQDPTMLSQVHKAIDLIAARGEPDAAAA